MSFFSACFLCDDDEIHALCQSQWERKNLLHLGQGPVCCAVMQLPKSPSCEGKPRQPRASALQWVKPLSQSQRGVSWANLTSPAWLNKPGYCQQLSSEVCNAPTPPFVSLPDSLLHKESRFYNARRWHLRWVREWVCFWVVTVEKMNEHRENPVGLHFSFSQVIACELQVLVMAQ